MVYNMSKVGWRPYRHLVLGFGFWVLGLVLGLGVKGVLPASFLAYIPRIGVNWF
jgi:hypothetical protein